MRTKRVLFMFQPLEYKAMAEYFEQMAAKGWMLKKMGSLLLTFEECEPVNMKFTVDIFPDISIFEGQGKAEARTYREYCEQSGWRFVTSFTKFQVFSAPESEQPVPIQTDEEIEQKLLKKSFWGSELYLVALALFYILTRWKDYVRFPYHLLYSDFQMACYLVFPLITIMLLLIPADFFLTLVRAKYRIHNQKPIIHRSLKQAKRLAVLSWLLIGIMILMMAAAAVLEGKIELLLLSFLPVAIGLAVGIAYRSHVEKSGSSKGSNIAKLVVMLLAAVVISSVTLIAFTFNVIGGQGRERTSGIQAPVLLSLEQLEQKGGNTTVEEENSLLVPVQYELSELAGEQVLFVNVEKAAAKSLAAYLFWQHVREIGERSEVQSASLGLWEVEQALFWENEKTGYHWLLLLKDDTVFQIRTDADLNTEKAVSAVKEMVEKFTAFY